MSDTVQQIKDRLNIIDVISPYVELHKAGRHFKARCPFHNEKTPSFNVSPERGMYHCYGCGVGGDMFTFIQEIEGVDFKEALKMLADKAGVPLVPVSPQKKTEQDRSYGVLEEATVFYEASLRENTEVQQYILKRGVLAATMATWRLGFAPGPPEAGWRAAKEYLSGKGYTKDELLRAGLIKGGEDGKEPYDVFRKRVMFPIFNQGGKVVAFSGRTVEKGDDIPKYVNSPETELFKKSEILYGYHKAKHGIRQLGFSLIVEGQFDVVMSHQAGYSNTVAVSGTALTVEHVQLLERLSDKVVLALDADKAGIAAIKKAADLMLRRGLDVKVAVMPEGADPADMILRDPKEFKQIVGKSVHVIEFLLSILAQAKLEERTFKLRAREEVLPYVLLLPNRIDQDHFTIKIAEALGTTKDAVHFELERLSESAEHSAKVVPSVNQGKVVSKKDVGANGEKRKETLLTYLLGVLPLFKPEVTERLVKEIEVNTELSLVEIENIIPKSELAEVTFRMEAALDQYPRKVFEDEVVHAFNQLREVMIRQKLQMARKKISEAEKEGDTETVASSMKEVGELQLERQRVPYDQTLIH
ncbi:MAG: DNA primase [Candidatus Nomurabacteria bacterium]|nr:MAG: DNA primase [Candidatus Nomurabacteria bacterium]